MKPATERFTPDAQVFQRVGASRQTVFERPIDQNKGDSTGSVSPVNPSMIGTTLNDDVARLDGYFPLIDQQGDLSRQHNAVVN